MRGDPSGDADGPWRRAEFRWFFVGRLVSLTGSAMSPVALSFAVLRASGRADDLAVVLAANSLTLVAFLLLGGTLADRLPRAPLLVAANLAAAATQGAVAALLLAGHYQLWALVALEAVNGGAAALTTPALRGIVPQLVAPAALQRANSVLATARNATKVLGPTLAGVLVATTGGGWAIAADAASSAAAAACLARLRLPPQPARVGVRAGMLADLREGWRTFRGLPWAVTVVASMAGVNFVLAGVWLVLGPSIAAATVGPTGWGLALSGRATGLLVAGVAMYRLSVTHPLRWSQLGASGLALPMLALGSGAGAPLLVGGAFLAGVGASVTAITWEPHCNSTSRTTPCPGWPHTTTWARSSPFRSASSPSSPSPPRSATAGPPCSARCSTPR
jgi:MFS family permease